MGKNSPQAQVAMVVSAILFCALALQSQDKPSESPEWLKAVAVFEQARADTADSIAQWTADAKRRDDALTALQALCKGEIRREDRTKLVTCVAKPESTKEPAK